MTAIFPTIFFKRADNHPEDFFTVMNSMLPLIRLASISSWQISKFELFDIEFDAATRNAIGKGTTVRNYGDIAIRAHHSDGVERGLKIFPNIAAVADFTGSPMLEAMAATYA